MDARILLVTCVLTLQYHKQLSVRGDLHENASEANPYNYSEISIDGGFVASTLKVKHEDPERLPIKDRLTESPLEDGFESTSRIDLGSTESTQPVSTTITVDTVNKTTSSSIDTTAVQKTHATPSNNPHISDLMLMHNGPAKSKSFIYPSISSMPPISRKNVSDNTNYTAPIPVTTAMQSDRKFVQPTRASPNVKQDVQIGVPPCNKLRCKQNYHVSSAIVVDEDLKPWGANVTFECFVGAPSDANITVAWIRQDVVKWNAPSQSSPQVILQVERVEATGRGNETTGFKSTLELIDIARTATGFYTCSVQVDNYCCAQNDSHQFLAYSPPHYMMDVTVVVSVCFVEIILVLVLNNVSNRMQSRNRKDDMIPLQNIHYTPIKISIDRLDRSDEVQECSKSFSTS